jgi:TRAP-type uncharacterized transport system fused permease subunit
MQRWTGISGLVFVALIIGSIVAGGGQSPEVKDSGAKVVKYYANHETGTRVEVYLIAVAVAVAVFFFWQLRTKLVALSDRFLPSLGFVGAILFMVAGTLASSIYWALAEGADHHFDESSMRTLNILQGTLPDITSDIGIAVLLFANGLAIIHSTGLPTWTGGLGVVFGVVSMVLTLDVGLPALGIWMIVICIVLIVRASAQDSAPQTSAPQMAGIV